MKKAVVGLVVVALLGLSIATEHQLRQLPGEDPLGEELLYLPTLRAVKMLSLDNHELAADVIYLWAIQYYSLLNPHERFLYLDHMFNLITDLDPLYFDAYTLGGLIMSMSPDRYRQPVIALYRKGIEAMPGDFRLGEIAAWDFHSVWKDDAVATRFLELVKDRPGVPARIHRVLGRWRDDAELWSYQESIDYWEQALTDATSDQDRRFCHSHLYDAIAARDRFVLNPILGTYVATREACPASFQVLVDEDILPSVPLDAADHPYGIDPRTCQLMPLKRLRDN